MTSDQPTVTIYSSPTCVYCRDAKEYFSGKGIDYTDKDISTDAEAYEYVITKIGQAVTPIITIGELIIIGFDRPKIEETLSKPRSSIK